MMFTMIYSEDGKMTEESQEVWDKLFKDNSYAGVPYVPFYFVGVQQTGYTYLAKQGKTHIVKITIIGDTPSIMRVA